MRMNAEDLAMLILMSCMGAVMLAVAFALVVSVWRGDVA